MQDTLLLIVGISVFLLLVMLLTRPKARSRPSVPLHKPEAARQPIPRNQPIPRSQPAPRAAEAMWERKVLTQLRGDRAALERLLAYQTKRTPRASRKQLLELLHADYIRDQR